MTNRKTFFETVRETLGKGHLSQPQVDGFLFLLGKMEIEDIEKHYAAYMLATVWHETARTMQPVREAFNKSEDWRQRNLRYFPYYGRGYVQLTWKENYQKFGDRLGIDLVGNPDLAMEPETAWKIMLDGMSYGLFTGKGLKDYINDERIDFTGARRIINGTDKAAAIATYANQFLKAL